MIAEKLLDTLLARGVELWCEGDRLRCRAPKGTLTRDDDRLLSEHKPEIMALLRARAVDLDTPTSATQQALWFVQRSAPASTAYNTGFAGRFREPIDIPALRRAVATLLDRHAVLRAVFPDGPDGPIQRIRARTEVPFKMIDASTWTEDELAARVHEDFHAPFDIEHDSVFRCRLFTRAADDHLLVVAVHHIAFDGGSVGILLDDLRTLYRAEAQNVPTGLRALPVTFADHIRAERELLSGPRGAALWQWWQDKLGDAPPLDFATDAPRPPLKSYRGAIVPFRIEASIGAAVKSLSRQLETTPFAVFLTAFVALLARYTGQTDIVLGTPMSGRSDASFDRVIGCFMNLVPLRIDLSANPTFADAVQHARDVTVTAIEHRAYPFSLLASRLSGRRDPGRPPLCQIAFAYQSETVIRGTAGFLFANVNPSPSIDFGGLVFQPFLLPQQEGQFDIMLEMIAPGGGDALEAHFKYDPDLFREETIRQLSERFLCLLEAAVHAPATRISTLPLLTKPDREQLATWNRTGKTYPQHECLHTLVSAQAERTPDAIAIWHEGRRVTYRELDNAANRLAHRLVGLGVGPEQVVGVCLERTPLLIVALLAVMKAGGAYAPLDPAYPPDRLSRMLDVAGAPIILTAKHLEKRLPAPDSATHVLLDDWNVELAARDEHATHAPATNVTSDNLAYLIFTSGSTGRPKGVAIEHRSATNLMHWARDSFTDEELAGMLGGTSVCFDLSVFEIFVTLSWGGRLVLVDNVLHLVRLDQTADVRLINTVPSAMAEILRIQGIPSSVRTILLAGERLTSALVDEIHTRAKVRLVNLYAPSETTTYSVWTELAKDHRHPPPIGLPMTNQHLHVLDAFGHEVPVGVLGEAYLGGAGVARGYLGEPALTAARFVPDPFRATPGARLYRTGDVVRRWPDGQVEYVGRADHQVKLRGFRIELEEVDETLTRHPEVSEAVTIVREHAAGDARMFSYVAPRTPTNHPDALAETLRRFLADRLPHYMVPSRILVCPTLPHTPNGKIDRRHLPEIPSTPQPARNTPSNSLTDTLVGIWRDVLGLERVGIDDNFFDLGGHSLLLGRIHARLTAALDKPVPLVDLLRFPTIAALAKHIEGVVETERPAPTRHDSAEPIAVIGMACRFPGADTPEAFFANLCNGVESVTFFGRDELAAHVPKVLLDNPAYVKARAILAGIDQFDAEFFGYAPHEAELLDPQQRVFLEVAWEALERAGIAPSSFSGRIGLYAGTGLNTYLHNNLGLPQNNDYMAPEAYQTYISSDKDFLATRVCYKLGLNGPGVTVQSACSTSLVAIHQACESLRRGECDVVMAGGSTISVPHRIGYVYRDGMIASVDGHCRPFDANASGTVFGSGVGVVVLRRLRDALAAGDRIDAVIRGSAINNDGADKIGYTAPSVAGQTAVIKAALQAAGVDPSDIGYIETHGTGTSLGDAVEATALRQVFENRKAGAPPITLGAVKSNVGHLDTAAGVAGFMKTVLAVKHGRIPPTLHYLKPNPNADLESARLRVAATLEVWPAEPLPRRAGISAFGIGGTNAHVIVEEPPAPNKSIVAKNSTVLLPISARHPDALRELAVRYAALLRDEPESLVDICTSAARRRVHHGYRAAFVADDHAEMLRALESCVLQGAKATSAPALENRRRIVFVCPGQGSQWETMGKTLLQQEPIFAQAMQECDAAVRRHGGFSLLACLQGETGAERLERIDVIQPALFAMSVALGALWRSWGIEPDAVIGHSMGELAAAHIAGALSLDDAARVICVRSRMMRSISGRGAMALIELPQSMATTILSERKEWSTGLSIAAANSRSMTVIAGDPSALQLLLEVLEHRGVFCRKIKVDVASHSPHVDALLPELRAQLTDLSPRLPHLHWHSTVEGKPMDHAPDAEYWARNLRDPVQFADGIVSLARLAHSTFIELSPHPVLLPDIEATLHGEKLEGRCLASFRRDEPERRRLLEALGNLYVSGSRVEWSKVFPDHGRSIQLPTYPWQRRRHWIERRTTPSRLSRETSDEHPLLGRRFDPATMPGTHWWETEINLERLPFLADHRVRGLIPFPAAAFVEAMLGATNEISAWRGFPLADVQLERMLTLSPSENTTLQVTLEKTEGNGAEVRFLVRDEGAWHLHAKARVGAEPFPAGETPESFGADMRDQFTHAARRTVTGEVFYDELLGRGFDFGPSFRINQRLWYGDRSVLARMKLPAAAGDAGPYRFHPALLDGLLQLLGAAAAHIAPDGAFVPFSIEGVKLLQSSTSGDCWGYAQLRPGDAEHAILGDLALYDETGAPLLRVRGLRLHRLSENAGMARFVQAAPPSWYWHIDWRSAPLVRRGNTIAGGWLLIADAAGHADKLAELLAAAGKRCVVVHQDAVFEERSRDSYRLDITRIDHVQQLLERAFEEMRAPCHGVVHVASVGRSAVWRDDHAHEGFSVLATVKAIARMGWRNWPRLWLVTGATQPVLPDEPIQPLGAALWGMARSLMHELPTLRVSVVDVSAAVAPELASLAAELLADGAEDQVALRQTSRWIARLAQTRLAAPSPQSVVRDDASYLVTGGLGALGLAVARWMAEQGAGKLWLVGRRPPSDEVQNVLRELIAAGTAIETAEVDVTNGDSLTNLFERIHRTGPPLRGIVHAAGVLDDGISLELDADRYRRVVEPKVSGAWLLHEHTRTSNLDFFVLFSSGVALLGGPAQVNHAAANAFMDALAHHRRRLGLPALSLNWGPWSSVGHAAALIGDRIRGGLTGIAPARGLATLGRLLALDGANAPAQVGVFHLDVRLWRDTHLSIANQPLLGDVATNVETNEVRGKLGVLLGELAVEQRRTRLEREVTQRISEVLGVAPTEIKRTTPLAILGLTSLLGLEIRNRLEMTVGISGLSATLVWAYPNVAAISEHLAERLGVVLEQTAVPIAVVMSSNDDAASELARELASLPADLLGDE